MHPQNPHKGRYDFGQLCQSCPELSKFLRPNPKGDQTIDFGNPEAVLCLNRTLLIHFYKVEHWTIPPGYLCPGIPGRADYIHHLADLIGADGKSNPDTQILDIGTGASCIYPIIGSRTFGWSFVGSEIDPKSLRSARAIVEANPNLQKNIRIAHQADLDSVMVGLIEPGDHFDAVMCNPPFHASAEAALEGNQRKVRNLNRGRSTKASPKLNFGGQASELWCPGGELSFLGKMIRESSQFSKQVGWFTSLVSNREHLAALQAKLRKMHVAEERVIPMQQGQKTSRILAWRF